jgi:hypothetical protein
MMRASPLARSTAAAWTPILLLAGLLALRVPSIVEPAGGDQGLYGYAGQRVLAGAVPYRDMWDQKPPGIAVVYAALWRLWPHESVVAAADLAAAAAVAGLLVVLGRRRFTANVGYGAAALFLLFGDPSLQRLSGIYVRGQCEPFMALAVTAALVLVAGAERRPWHFVLAGVSLAGACWLKYNAAAYALPLSLAAWAWTRDAGRGRAVASVAWIGLGVALVTIAVLGYFAWHGALYDLRLATIDYNLRYSNETYERPTSVVAYLVTLPLARARVDLLWFLGELGTLALAWQARSNRSALVVCSWVVAAVLSIAINGQRDLPNYFVQAAPALALAGCAGFTSVVGRAGWIRVAVAGLLLLGLWRVGDDTPVGGLRLGGLPGLVQNVRYDLAYARGHLDRATYLRRFKGQKFDALEIDALTQYVRQSTTPADPIFVFGFSGGSVCWKSERVSASRFFWSRPVIIEFAVDQPGYGSAGLLSDLRRRPPALVALQKEEWRSQAFFMGNAALRAWLESGYVLDRDTPMFAVWRRKA